MRVKNKRIVLTFSALARSSIGCYGASWNETPFIDRLAMNGCVFDHIYATNTNSRVVLDDLFQAFGGGELITDDPMLSTHTADKHFDQTTQIPIPSKTEPSTEIEDTHLAQLFACALDRIDSNSADQVWIHSRFLESLWDAPRWLVDVAGPDIHESGETLFDSNDSEAEPVPPEVFETIEPPSFELTEDHHPDVAVSWMNTYSCQVRLIDRLIGVLADEIGDDCAAMMLSGTSGFSFGESGLRRTSNWS